MDTLTPRRVVDVRSTDPGPVVSAATPTAAARSEVERTQDGFVTSVSHELRTPLTSILGYTSVLVDGAAGDLTPLQHRMVQRIESNGQRLLALVEDLLTLSGVETGTFCLVRTNVDLVDVVADSLARMAPALDAGGLALTIDLAPRPCLVVGDETQLGRVVACLVDNAVTSSRPGDELQVSLHHLDDELVLEVADAGFGIGPEDQERLFERFERTPGARTREDQGLGLGLAVVRSIVSSHGGQVSLASALGVGTTVTVRLPLAS